MVRAMESGGSDGPEVLTLERSGADFMVDVVKSLGFEYAAANPGSSFRGLQESCINYGHNRQPEWLTCCHEESSVAIAHGYAKVEGKPLLVAAHGTVGLQHAAMAVYNAFCDRVPVYIILGNTFDATMRRPGAEWVHSVQDAAAMVRDYVKWDDMPASLAHFAESAVRAYKIAMTPPMAPVVLVADSELQERAIEEPPARIPPLTLPLPPVGDPAAIAEAAHLLVAAEQPVIVADRFARTPAGMGLLVELAEVLQAAVVDQGARMNFPSRHPLNQGSGVLAGADVVLGLELSDPWGVFNTMRDRLPRRTSRSRLRAGTKVITITAGDLYTKSNYQDFMRLTDVDLAMAADAEATLPLLIEAVKREVTGDRRRVFEARGVKYAEARAAADTRAREDAAYAWDASPISTARLAAELWHVIQREDWALVNNSIGWPDRLWDFHKPYHHIGDSAGRGQGYGPPASVGAALAHRKHGRLCVNIQSDGDLMYAPGVLWTAAHHRIPLLSVVHNNRAYHAEVMHMQRMANRHQRGVDRAHIGCAISNPNIDYAKVAQGMGLYGEGPIERPADLGPALQRAVAVVKKGEPALVDVVTQPR
jgi:thiamine pyrophosphate-dependent acetolactate synthase large subunit-like protein